MCDLMTVLRKIIWMVVAVSSALVFGVRSSAALEELKVFRGFLILEGKIVPGDYKKVRDFLGEKANFEKITGGVFLASPGGNVTEALKIGRLIRSLRLSTDAPSGPATGIPRFGESLITPNLLVNARADYGCASACFFIYVAGVYRHLNWTGRLGYHRPIELESEASKLDVDQALNRTWRVRQLIQKYLADMDVPDKYIDLIYSVPFNEVHWVTQNEFDSDLQGLVPEAKAWIGAKCANSGEKNTQNSGKPSLIEDTKISVGNNQTKEIRCWMQLKTELSNEAWNKTFINK
jgi:hypothetical protein